MIPVQVAVQDRELRSLALAHQALPQPANAGAAVEDDVTIAAHHFDARGVAAEFNGVRTGRGNRAANAQNVTANVMTDLPVTVRSRCSSSRASPQVADEKRPSVEKRLRWRASSP